MLDTRRNVPWARLRRRAPLAACAACSMPVLAVLGLVPKSGFKRGDDQHSEEAVDNRPASPHQAGSANDHGRDGGELEPHPGVGIGGAQARGVDAAGLTSQ